MIFVSVVHRAEEWDVPSREDTISFGRAVDQTVMLASDRVGRRHCRLESRAGALVLVDLRSPSGTFVDGVRIGGEHPLAIGDAFTFGDVAVTVLGHGPETFESFGEEEARFLETIEVHPDDDETRLVYADALEERGFLDRATWLRTELALRHAAPEGSERERLLAAHVAALRSVGQAPAWLMRVRRRTRSPRRHSS